MNDEFLIFDIWGEAAHFRRYDTTSSPLSWPFPPRPTVFGMLGAILGYKKNDYLAKFQDENIDVAISIQQRPRSLRISFNDTETKGVKLFRTTRHTQIRREILADARYRLFVRHTNTDVQTRLTDLVRAHQSVYTVSLGQASLLADFAFVASMKPETLLLNETTVVMSIVPFNVARPVKAPDAAPLLINSLPRQMTPERIVTAYQDVVYDARRSGLLICPRSDGGPATAYSFDEFGIVVPL